MKIKSIALSLVLFIGFSADMSLVAQPNNGQSNLIKRAQAEFSEFREAVKCTWRKKGCDRKARRKVIATGLAITATAVALATGVWLVARSRAVPRPAVSVAVPVRVPSPAPAAKEEKPRVPRAYRVPAAFGGIRPSRDLSLEEGAKLADIQEALRNTHPRISIPEALQMVAKDDERVNVHVKKLSTTPTSDIVAEPVVLDALYKRFVKGAKEAAKVPPVPRPAAVPAAKPAVVAASPIAVSPQISAGAENIDGLRRAYKKQMWSFKTFVDRGRYSELVMGPILGPLKQKTSHLPEGDDRRKIEESWSNAEKKFYKGKQGLVRDAGDRYREFIQEINRGAGLLFDTIEKLGKTK